jgi:hypothetical protein
MKRFKCSLCHLHSSFPPERREADKQQTFRKYHYRVLGLAPAQPNIPTVAPRDPVNDVDFLWIPRTNHGPRELGEMLGIQDSIYS